MGLGWPGQQHAKALLASERAQLYACADLNDERRAAFAAEFSPEKQFASVTEMLADPELEAIIVCLPNSLHFSVSMAALEAGKHVLCEKPPTINAAEMKVLRDEAQRRQLVYFFGRQFRFSPAMLRMKEVIAQGRLGSIYFGKAVWVRSRGTPTGVDGWFTEKRRAGGGALIDIGVHALDAVWYLMGTPRPVSVTAGVFQNFAHLVKAPVFDVEDAAYAFLRFENGAVVQLESCWAGNLTDDIPEGGWSGRELQNCTLYGSGATIRMEPLTLFKADGATVATVPLTPLGRGNAFELQLENFLAAVAGEIEPENNAQQAVYLMEMLDAIYASSSMGREVPLA